MTLSPVLDHFFKIPATSKKLIQIRLSQNGEIQLYHYQCAFELLYISATVHFHIKTHT